MSSAAIRHALVPMLVGYLVLMAVLAIGLHQSRRTGRAPADRPGPVPVPASDAGPAPVPATNVSTVPVPAPGTAAPPGPGPASASLMPAEVSESAAAGRAADPAELSWRSLARHGLGTAAGGYTLLVAVIVGYYYAVARVGGDFIDSAFSGTAVLLGIAIPVFAALSWLAERRRRDGDSHPGQRGPG